MIELLAKKQGLLEPLRGHFKSILDEKLTDEQKATLAEINAIEKPKDDRWKDRGGLVDMIHRDNPWGIKATKEIDE